MEATEQGGQEPGGGAIHPRERDTGVLALIDLVNPPLPAAALVLGGGYTGRRFAAALRARGCAVTLTTRGEPPAPGSPASAGCRWLRFDPQAGAVPSTTELAGIEAVLSTIPPDVQGRDPVLEHLGGTLRALKPQWIGYLSTTGVYGDSGGAWVDEDSPARPGLPRSIARLSCEQAWRRLELPLQILRLPAIYGPGRSPLDSLRNGTARLIHKPGQVFSRVHVDDIVGALLHCLTLPAGQRPPILILADSCPCPSSEMLGYAAHLLGVRLPPLQPYAQIEAELSPMARSFWSENRRASSRRLRKQLGYRLLYRSYREGLAALSGTGTGTGAPAPAQPETAD